MSTIQMTLSIVGGMLIPVSLYGLRRRRISTTESEWQMPLCATPSPDQTLLCKQELGHLGWHEGETKSWYGDCWFEGRTTKSDIERSGRNQPRRPLTDEEKQLIKSSKNGNWRPGEAPWRQFEYVGRSAATSKARRTQPKPPQAAPPKPPQPKPAYPNIIGPEPIRVRVGMFGTRRTLPNDRDRKSA